MKSDRAKDEWPSGVPLVYQDTIYELVPDALRKAILSYKYGPTGIVLFGPSGTYKTRIMYILIKRLFSEGHSVEIFGGKRFFADECAQAYASGQGPEWIRRVCAKHILFFEDMAKDKWTDRAGEALYQVVEGRTANYMPILAASNCKLIDLVDRLGQDRGIAIIRRLSEFCLTLQTKFDGKTVSVEVVSKPDPLILKAWKMRNNE